ncbi:MAG: hypothetical protein ABI210_09515 [Abditibacteriaceae bacterium]
MLNMKRGLKLFCWTAVLMLAIAPLASTAHADNANQSNHNKNYLGLKVAVVAASDVSGNKDTALRALQAANIGLERQPGYIVVDPQDVAKSLQSANLHWPFAPKQYPGIRKKLDGADRVLSISVSPQPGSNAAYNAVAELYDTQTGGIVGRGQSLYTVFSSAPDAKNTDPQMRAVDGAVLEAIADMSKPAVLNGVVLNHQDDYRVRISMGSYNGLRNGSRIEYVADGKAFAYGTVISLGTGDSIATVAPESAYGQVQANTQFRTADIPPAGLMGLSEAEISKKEFDKFSKQFAFGAALATVAYLIADL